MSRDFDELVGEVDGAERERLLRTHELLIAAGPPPELPPTLAQPPGGPGARSVVRPLSPGFHPRRRAVAGGLLAAALVLAAFAAGFFVGDRDEGFAAVRTVALQGAGPHNYSRGSLQLGEQDASGNWPMLLRVNGLPELKSPRGYYEVRLMRDGRAIAPCGSFRVRGSGTTEVELTAGYVLERFDAWVVVVHERGHVDEPPVVMESSTI
jgi:hypothetical protein